MKPSELLDPTDVLLDFRPADKWQAIRDLVRHLVANGKLPSEHEDVVLDAVLDRERSMSTGMERGVAVPHAAVEDVSEALAVLGVVQDGPGLEFDSQDGQGARVVMLLVIPKGQSLLHIRTLADIARVLSKDSVRTKLYETSEQAEAHAVLVAGES